MGNNGKLELTPSQRSFLFESFRSTFDVYIRDKFGRQAFGATQLATMKEALRFYFIHLSPDVILKHRFPKKGEPREEYYLVKIDLSIPGLTQSMEFEKKFDKHLLETR